MKKQLQTVLPLIPTEHRNWPEPHFSIKQAAIEEEFLREIDMLKKAALGPRRQTISNLLDIIADQGVAHAH
ncbi:MAG: hypothetical protein QM642_10265 [Edaphocola sp.]